MARHCDQCGDEANTANMHRNYDGKLICSNCFRSEPPAEAPEMPTVEEILE